MSYHWEIARNHLNLCPPCSLSFLKPSLLMLLLQYYLPVSVYPHPYLRAQRGMDWCKAVSLHSVMLRLRNLNLALKRLFWHLLCRLFLLQSLCGLMSRAEQPHGSDWCCFRMRNEPGASGTSSSLATYKFPWVTETMYLFHWEGAELHQEESLLSVSVWLPQAVLAPKQR